MPAALALALIAATAQPSPFPDEGGTLTRAEVRTMSPEALTRRLFGDLARVMFPQPYYDPPRTGRLRSEPLHALSFLTRPYRTGLAGVCQTNMFFVGFEIALGALGEDPPVQPSRVQMFDHIYFVSDLALARGGEMTEDAAAGPDCTRVDPRTVTIIAAGSEGIVVGAVQRFADLLDGARVGRVAAALDCRDQSGAVLSEAACLAMLAHYRAERIHVIGDLPGCGRNATDAYCERIETSLDDQAEHLEIVFETPHGDGPDIVPSRIRVAPVPPDTSYQVE
jgi:hypothetical protein